MSLLALIDGDILVYRCGFAAEHTHYTVRESATAPSLYESDSWAEVREWLKAQQSAQDDASSEPREFHVDRERYYEPLSHALANVRTVMNTIINRTRADKYQVYLSSGECFRSQLATIKKYKGNRDEAAKPMYYKEIRGYLTDNWNAHTCYSVEADDALAMAQNNDALIVSIDKDLLQVPGKHYNWVDDAKILITPDVGMRKRWLQVITGDSTDNIPGIKGLGPVKARAAIKDVPNDEEALRAAVTGLWGTYLQKEPEGFKIVGPDQFSYVAWDDTEKAVSTADVVREVHDLIEVGGDNAKSILKRTGEEIPFTG